MIDFHGKIKKNITLLLAVYHLVFLVFSAVFLYFIMRNSITKNILLAELILIICSIILYVIVKYFIMYYVMSSTGTLEAISNSILKNTRMVINNISHEIRTPLNAIMGFAVSLYDNEEDENKRDALYAIKNNSDRLFSITKKLIDFSSIEIGLFPIEKEYFKVDSLLVNLMNKYKESLIHKSLQLNIKNSIPENYEIFSDYNILFEILDMFLENAIKFTDEGSITVSSSYETGNVSFTVCDTGIGVPDNNKKLIFRLYSQANLDINRDYEGLGLGLTISNKLVDLLGGTISLTDNINGGSCFHIIIPLPFRLNDHKKRNSDVFFIPDSLTNDNKKELKKMVLSLSEYKKVFNPGKIRYISSELVKINPEMDGISKKLIKIADTYNEVEFSLIVEEMLKVIKNEE